MTVTWLPLLAAFLAACATVLGGLLIFIKRKWEDNLLKYSISFGAGFMMAAAALAMIPESFKLSSQAGIFLLLGYLTLHFFEHTIVPHFHFGEETHSEYLVNSLVSYSSIVGLSIHNLFDGISIGAGFMISPLLGVLIFGAVALHKLPDGFTMASIMIASGRSGKTAFYASVLLGISTLAGALLISYFGHIVRFALPFSAGVTLYIAATDLMPIINETRGFRYSFAFFAGILIFYVSDLFLSKYLQR